MRRQFLRFGEAHQPDKVRAVLVCGFLHIKLRVPVWKAAIHRVLVLAGCTTLGLSLHAATNDPAMVLQQALFEEEVNQNLPAAIQAYQSLITSLDAQRKLAATALFRLGECYRKQGNTNAAAAQYDRILRDFTDQEQVVRFSRDNLVLLGVTGQGMEPAEKQTGTEARAGDLNEINRIRTLIRNSPDLINAPQKYGRTLLEDAAGNGNLEVAAVLLDSGAAAEGIRQPGLTPLHYAAANGHKAMVELLLKRGARPNVATEKGVTPLHLAAMKGFESLASVLLEAGAVPNVKTTGSESRSYPGDIVLYSVESGQTPLHLAASAGFVRVAKLLINKRAEIDAVSGVGRTALSYAVQRAFQPVADSLLQAKADPNAGNLDLPLHVAVYNGDQALVGALLASGADPNMRCKLDWSVQSRSRGEFRAGATLTSLFLAIVKQDRTDDRVAIVRKLIQAKANSNEPGLIFEALSEPRFLALLLEGKADPNQVATGKDLSTPLLDACKNNLQESAELLLRAGADVNATNGIGTTPLHLASQPEIVRLLVSHGAQVNARDRELRTPLHYAVAYERRDAVELLLSSGADPNVVDRDGKTALDFALGSPPGTTRRALADLLRQHGATTDLPRMDRIELRRGATGYVGAPIVKGTNDWSRFGILDFLGFQYGFLVTRPDGEVRPRVGGMDSSSSFSPGVYPAGNKMKFPALGHIKHLTPTPDQRGWRTNVVNLAALLASSDCTQNRLVGWGDVIEVPEEEHPINQAWEGFLEDELASISKCLSREVKVIIQGQDHYLKLTPEVQKKPAARGVPIAISTTCFWIKPALFRSNLVLSSSDLSRVKVSRKTEAGERKEWIVDCSENATAPDLWLSDGDVIEVPEKR